MISNCSNSIFFILKTINAKPAFKKKNHVLGIDLSVSFGKNIQERNYCEWLCLIYLIFVPKYIPFRLCKIVSFHFSILQRVLKQKKWVTKVSRNNLCSCLSDCLAGLCVYEGCCSDTVSLSLEPSRGPRNGFSRLHCCIARELFLNVMMAAALTLL